jgi:AcrR family transcriptional regulator
MTAGHILRIFLLEGTLSSGPVRSRRETNKAAIRARLVAAGLKLAATRGYDATTVAAIAERAGVAKGTFFNYFPTKEALIVHHYEALFARVEELVAATPTLPARDWFVTLFTQMAKLLTPERDLVVFVLSQAHRLRTVGALETKTEQRLKRLYGATISRGKAEGELSRDHESGAAATVLHAIWSTTLEEWAGSDGRLHLGRELARRVNLVFRGLESRGR